MRYMKTTGDVRLDDRKLGRDREAARPKTCLQAAARSHRHFSLVNNLATGAVSPAIEV